MLDWFGRKLREMQEVKRDERGFTLIELLVVVIIIGILAAIAIPTFLAQRDNADDATARSDLRNLAASAAAFAADNDGNYTNATTGDMDAAILASDYDWNQSASTSAPTVTVATNDESYVATITSDTTTVFEIDSETGIVDEQ